MTSQDSPNFSSQSSGFDAAGTVQKICGIVSYVTGHPDSKLAILLIADALGFEEPNLRKLADKVAVAGFLVVVPDLLYGDYFDLHNPHFDRAAWMASHKTEKGFEDVKPIIAALKSKGVCAIGVAGFCWGGVVSVKLASTSDIQAAVVLHPGPINEDEIKEVKVPIALLGAETDSSTPPEKLKQFGEILSLKNEVEVFVKIYPGVTHGWTLIYDNKNEAAVKKAEEAHEDLLNWFTKHVN